LYPQIETVSDKKCVSDTEQTMKKLRRKEQLGVNFSYPSSAAVVVFGGYLSALAVFRLDRKSPAIRPCV
jgi:hypothetical protein